LSPTGNQHSPRAGTKSPGPYLAPIRLGGVTFAGNRDFHWSFFQSGEAVFSSIRTLWQDAKADAADDARLEEIDKDALSLLHTYEKLDALQRPTFTRAYHLAKKHLEQILGDSTEWEKANQMEAAKTLMDNARKAVDAEPRGAMGIALLSLFLEVNTLRSKRAEELSAQIDQWYHRAVERDLSSGEQTRKQELSRPPG
jgi:hypothetical protein